MRWARAASVLASLTLACGASQDGGAHGPSVDFDGGSIPPHDAAPPITDAAAPIDADAAPAPTGASPEVWQPRAIYLVMPDRFVNGDPSNDDVGQPNCHDPASASLFHGGDLAGIREEIPYLAELGVGAVWTTPFYAQAPLRGTSCGYHGYWADFAFPDDGAMEPKLGTLDEARGLSADLHAAGMRLVIDMVVNHAARNARIVTEQPTWFHDPQTCGRLGDPNVYCPLDGLPDFRQEDPTVAAYLSGASKAWVERLAPDGIRMDTAKNVGASYFESSWTPAVRAARGDLFLVAEYFDEGAYSNFLPVLDAGFDSTFDFPRRRAFVQAFAQGGSVDLVASKVADAIATLGIDRARMLTTIVDNHDVPRFLSDAPAGLSAAELARRYELAMTALFTLPGIPQLYYGDEIGMLGDAANDRHDMPAWAFSAATRAGTHPEVFGDAQATFALVQALAAMRAQSPALYKGRYAELWRQNAGPANTFAFFRADGDARALVVLHAGDGPSGTLALPFATLSKVAPEDRTAWPDGTTLVDALATGAGAPTATISGGRIQISMTRKGAAIYVKKP